MRCGKTEQQQHHTRNTHWLPHLPIELLNVFVRVQNGALGGLVEEEVADELVVLDVVLPVHRDGAVAVAAPDAAARRGKDYNQNTAAVSTQRVR